MAHEIAAENIQISPSAKIGDGVRIRGTAISIGPNVSIGAGADISCDELTLEAGCRIAPQSQIVCPVIAWGEGCSSGKGFEAELNEHFRMGRYSSIGNRVAVAGQGFHAGEFLWLKDDVIVGGGGNKGPDSFFVAGDRTSVFDRSYVNLSERVSLGSDTALSYNVVVLTHGAWQPAFMGYSTAFAPVSVGDFCVIYLNSVLLPGVKVGDYSTVGAGAVVTIEVPAHCLAVGNPAVIKRGPEGYPRAMSQERQEQLVLQILAEYSATLKPKDVRVISDEVRTKGWFRVEFEGEEWEIGFGTPRSEQANTISLSFGSSSNISGKNSHFDLQALTLEGHPSPLAEDLRDYLRRRAVRVFTGKPFRTLPLSNLRRLKNRG